jgi:hypothetical protein
VRHPSKAVGGRVCVVEIIVREVKKKENANNKDFDLMWLLWDSRQQTEN